MIINNYFNPFSRQFQSTAKDYQNLPLQQKILAVISSIVGGLLTPFILFTGSFALFQLTVRWLKEGDDSTADRVQNTIRQFPVFTPDDSEEADDTTFTETTIRDFTGNGELLFANGDRYEGSFVEGKMQGKGKLTYNNGTIFEGYFENNRIKNTIIHDTGKFTFLNGDVYTGSIRDGKMSGPGRLEFGGHVYEGVFANGKKHGKGKISYSSGDTVNGTFQQDLLTSGLYTYANHPEYKEYHGRFTVEGKFGGWGRLNYKDGRIVRGWWQDGIRHEQEAVHKNYPKDVWG